MEKAVVDRIVDGLHAVLLAGEFETETIVPASLLPPAAGPGTWLQVERSEDGVIVRLSLDTNETQSVKNRVAAKLAELRRRSCNQSAGK